MARIDRERLLLVVTPQRGDRPLIGWSAQDAVDAARQARAARVRKDGSGRGGRGRAPPRRRAQHRRSRRWRAALYRGVHAIGAGDGGCSRALAAAAFRAPCSRSRSCRQACMTCHHGAARPPRRGKADRPGRLDLRPPVRLQGPAAHRGHAQARASPRLEEPREGRPSHPAAQVAGQRLHLQARHDPGGRVRLAAQGNAHRPARPSRGLASRGRRQKRRQPPCRARLSFLARGDDRGGRRRLARGRQGGAVPLGQQGGDRQPAGRHGAGVETAERRRPAISWSSCCRRTWAWPIPRWSAGPARRWTSPTTARSSCAAATARRARRRSCCGA